MKMCQGNIFKDFFQIHNYMVKKGLIFTVTCTCFNKKNLNDFFFAVSAFSFFGCKVELIFFKQQKRAKIYIKNFDSTIISSLVFRVIIPKKRL